MGQYYLVCNIDKKQYLYPHKFGDGLKLLEFGSSGSGTMCGLAVLLANSNGRGGGDLRSESPIVGSWAGDRIVVAGDYGDPWVDPADLSWDGAAEGPPLFAVAEKEYEDISDEVIAALLDNEWLRRDLEKVKGHFGREALPVPYSQR